jgi:hypothetical protein
MKLTMVDVEAMLNQNERVGNLLRKATTQEQNATIKTVHHMMVTYARMEVELTKIVELGPPEEEEHRHKASCHGEAGEYMCGY